VKNKYLLVLLDQLISSGSNFLLAIYYARLLGPSDFGKYSLILYLVFLVVGVQQAFIYTTMNTDSHQFKVNKISYDSLILLKYIVMIGFIIVLMGGISLFDILQIGVLVIIFMILYTFSDLIKKIYLANFEYSKLLLHDITFYIVLLNLIMIVGVSDIEDIFYLNIISLTFPITFYVIFGKLKINGSRRKVKLLFRNELHRVKHLILATVLLWFNSRIGFYVLGFFSGNKVVGILSAYMSIIGIFNPVMSSLDNYLLPNASKKYKICGQKEVILWLDKHIYPILFLSLLITVLIGLYSKHIVLFILGNEYLEYHYLLTVFLFINVFLIASKKYIYLINILKQQVFLTQVNLLNFMIIAILIVPTTYYFGLNGYAVLMLFTASVYFFYLKRSQRSQ
jgi:O-antigen/teichoic acid export membrane protein